MPVAGMDEKRQTLHMEKLEDGREIRFKRDGKMKMYTPDGEIRDSDFRDAVAEIGRMDESKSRELAGRVTVKTIREMGTQMTRSATIGALQWATLKAPAAIRDGQRSNIAHIMSMAFQEMERGMRDVRLVFGINHTMPYTDEYNELVSQLFGEFGEGSRLMTPTTVVRGKNVKIGKRVVIMNNSLFMSAGGITIEDAKAIVNMILQ